MNNEIIEFRYNILDIPSITTFYTIKGGYTNCCKDVYFVRAKGIYSSLKKEIEELEVQMSKGINQGSIFYDRINFFWKLCNPDDVNYYSGCYLEWKNSNYTEVIVKETKGDIMLSKVMASACRDVLAELKKADSSINESMEKNFIIKILFWTDKVLEKAKIRWDIKNNMKVVVKNTDKKHEYLFCYFLTRLGYDVLLLQNSVDIGDSLRRLDLSKEIRIGDFGELDLEEFKINDAIIKNTEISGRGSIAAGTIKSNELDNTSENTSSADKISDNTSENISPARLDMSLVRRPDRDNKTRDSIVNSSNIQNNRISRTNVNNNGYNNPRTEKSFEELAQLASSVVMIAIHNKNNEVIGTGSGIMIGRNGYILTNNHVASGGHFYSVRIEEDEQIYETDEVIKYNPMLDLAIIRIQRRLNPLKVYNGKDKLVRGQKVVAIGSPLGLFNSVSDGIISGFRVFDEVDMIQFTAPTSHGSSGGAVLNMYGEVIGISTAGIDEGQNINLAMGYECINNFIRGFIDY